VDSSYHYLDHFREDIYRMVPPDGSVIGVVGCGRARTESRLVEEGREVHGVDISAEAIEVARRRLTSAWVIEANNHNPFEANTLDGLILADVVEHIPLAWIAFQSYSRMVKPGGWIVVSVPNMRYWEPLATFVIGGDWPEVPMGIFDRTHLQVMTHKRLVRWATAADLELEQEFDCYDFRLIPRNICRIINVASLRLFKSFLNFEIQARFRRVKNCQTGRQPKAAVSDAR
jgi:2-polyprenyl-3-methyl-5-hydroxy-6-metoxy-1,4-benzoquinol methylase